MAWFGEKVGRGQQAQQQMVQYVVKVTFDNREERSGVPEELSKRNVELQKLTLTIADYVVSSRVAIERKEGTDFVGSIFDGRLFEQAHRLRETYEFPIIIVEGSVFHGNISE